MADATKAVFLSYASEDTEAAQRIADALQSAGVEVWFDRSALRGGDAWDNAIRRQIRNCALFMPIISSNSHQRAEGYFRLEWKLAVDRSHLMATDKAFLVPVVIDATSVKEERVPDRFRELQWIHLPGGAATPQFVAHVLELRARAVPAGERLSSVEAGRAVPQEEASAAADTPVAQPVPARSRRAWLLAGAAGIAMLAFAGWYLARPAARTASVVPYSADDRRMTFAVLPFVAPPDDARAAQAAKATADVVATELETESLWAQSASRASVDQAAAQHTSPREIAKALNVHFLVRGTLARAGAGYDVNLVTLDGASEHVLGTQVLTIPPNALVPRWNDDVGDAVIRLIWFGLEAEVKAVADRKPEALDVRDLSFRALHDWRANRGAAAKAGYASAFDLLKRALELAPDDPLATYLMADLNLCDCVLAWSHNVEEQKAIGSAYLEKYLALKPNDMEMLSSKAQLYILRGRLEDASALTDTLLAREPENSFAQGLRALELIRAGRAREAVAIADGLFARYPDKWASVTALAADAHYAAGDYPGAAQLARNAISRLSEQDLREPVDGPVRWTLAAAEAHLGHTDQARAALADFNAAVPGIDSIAAMRKWIYPTANLYGFEPLFEGLKLAGVREQ